MPQQHLPRLPVAAAGVIRWYATLIAPEDIHLAPIHPVAKICSKQLKEAVWSTATIQCDQKTIAVRQSLRSLLDKKICREAAKFFQILEDADMGFHRITI